MVTDLYNVYKKKLQPTDLTFWENLLSSGDFSVVLIQHTDHILHDCVGSVGESCLICI